MSKQIIISEDALIMMLSIAHESGYKLAHETLSGLDIKGISEKSAMKIVSELKPKIDGET